jgi:hypothetical protein
MQHKKTIIILVVGALAIAMTFGGIAYRSVFAATPINTSSNTATQAPLIGVLVREPMETIQAKIWQMR